ncbi:MAG: hypothetical protein WD696_16120 [Bryobacteraceae bacterium]
MAAKSLKIDSLELDLENPRITLASDQRDAMQKIIKEQKVKLINLAESIADKGLSPMDRCLVLRSPSDGRFIVLEGNRRILAAKLLKNPSLVDSLEMPEGHKKRLQKAALTFDPKKIEPVDCYEVADRAEGVEWIRRRHTGEDEGRGIIPWSAVATARFRGRDAALQALDFVGQHGGITEEQADLIAGKFPLTTLDRLLSTPAVRKSLGFELVDGKLETELPPEEAMKPLRRIVVDLAEKKKTVSDLKSKDQQIAYINEFKASDRPNLSLKTGKLKPVEKISQKDFTAKPAPAPKKPKQPKAGPRTTVVPKSCKLNITTAKIEKIYGELRILQLAKHVHAIGVLLRVFLEMSVDDYLTKAGVPLTFQAKGGHTGDKKLAVKVEEAIDHMVANGATKKDFKGVLAGLKDDHHPFAIDTLHAYIHNRFFTPTEGNLVTGWDNAQRFFETIWP